MIVVIMTIMMIMCMSIMLISIVAIRVVSNEYKLLEISKFVSECSFEVNRIREDEVDLCTRRKLLPCLVSLCGHFCTLFGNFEGL